MPAEKVSIFTGQMRTDFDTAWAQLNAEQAPWEGWTDKIQSSSRIEHISWLTPTPGMGRYTGARRYGAISNYTYKLENLEYDGAFKIPLRDIEDDLTGGYAKKPAELAKEARNWPNYLGLQALANGSTVNCYDGAAFFRTSGGEGTVSNIITPSITGSATANHTLYFLFHGGPLKPLFYLDRKAPKPGDTGGLETSFEEKVVKYWVDIEGVVGYAWPWDAVKVTLTKTPTLAECEQIMREIVNAFRGFKAPKGLATDIDKYPHEQTQFSTANATLFCSGTGIEYLFKTVLTQSPLTVVNSNVTGQYLGMANVLVSNVLNP